jgi:uncharacterized protein
MPQITGNLLGVHEMNLDLTHVPESGLQVDAELDAREVDMAGTDAELAGNLGLRGQVLKAGEEIVLTGTLSGAFRLTCSRCLKDFVEPFEIEVSATYVPAAETQPKARDANLFHEDTRITFPGDEIDLISGIREDLMLNIPLKPLCRENCRGLCAQCGTDLNEGQCACAQEAADPRLAALRDISMQMKQQVRKQD